MPADPPSDSDRTEQPSEQRTELRDFYAVLGAEPSASAVELRAAFRESVLRHHPDRAATSDLATRRTSVLNRAWAVLRNPLRRLHYDRDLERGTAATLEWPLETGERASVQPPRARAATLPPSRWHQPQWRNVAGFRVPVAVWMEGPAAQDRWIVEHHIAGQDWRTHRERYWLHYAAQHYRDRNRIDDWIGALERLVALDPDFDTLVRANLREAYLATGMYLRGASFLQRVGDRWPAERAAATPIVDPGGWFSLVQILTEAGETERASGLLAEIARGDHPEALDRRLIRGDPVRRLSAARRRLTSAQRRQGELGTAAG